MLFYLRRVWCHSYASCQTILGCWSQTGYFYVDKRWKACHACSSAAAFFSQRCLPLFMCKTSAESDLHDPHRSAVSACVRLGVKAMNIHILKTSCSFYCVSPIAACPLLPPKFGWPGQAAHCSLKPSLENLFSLRPSLHLYLLIY